MHVSLRSYLSAKQEERSQDNTSQSVNSSAQQSDICTEKKMC